MSPTRSVPPELINFDSLKVVSIVLPSSKRSRFLMMRFKSRRYFADGAAAIAQCKTASENGNALRASAGEFIRGACRQSEPPVHVVYDEWRKVDEVAYSADIELFPRTADGVAEIVEIPHVRVNSLVERLGNPNHSSTWHMIKSTFFADPQGRDELQQQASLIAPIALTLLSLSPDSLSRSQIRRASHDPDSTKA